MKDFKFIWKIENYNCLLSQRGKALKSPLFNVANLEKTFLELYPKGDLLDPDLGSMFICLKNYTKLPNIKVACSMNFQYGEMLSPEPFFKSANDFYKWGFKKEKRDNITLSDEKMDEFAKATLVVTCHFFQDCTAVSESSPTTLNKKDADLLSKDMEKIYISEEFSDFCLSSGTENFPVHKALLYARIPKLIRDPDKVVHDLDPSTMRILLSYAYSGKLDASENIPSGLYKAADVYELTDLKQKLLSYPYKVIARSCIKVDNCEFIWSIPDVNTMENGKKSYCTSFSGRIIPGSDLKLSFCLVKSNGKDALKICIHRLFPNKDNPIFVMCRFTVNKLFIFAEHIFYSDEEWHFPSFIPIERMAFDTLEPESLSKLTIMCKFFISNDEIMFTEGAQYFTEKHENLVQHQEDTSNLCIDLDRLYNIFLPMVSDVTLMVGAVCFPAHKVVLAARSPVFARMFAIDMIEKKNGIVDIEDIEVTILDMMLTYMYSAKIKTLNFDTALKLYEAADMYEVISLKDHCASFLKLELSFLNCCELLIFADMHGDLDLKKYVEDFIRANAHEILAMPEWNQLIESRIELAKEILRSLTALIRTQPKRCPFCKE